MQAGEQKELIKDLLLITSIRMTPMMERKNHLFLIKVVFKFIAWLDCVLWGRKSKLLGRLTFFFFIIPSRNGSLRDRSLNNLSWIIYSCHDFWLSLNKNYLPLRKE